MAWRHCYLAHSTVKKKQTGLGQFACYEKKYPINQLFIKKPQQHSCGGRNKLKDLLYLLNKRTTL